MSKANENQARDSAKNLMTQAQTETAPVIQGAGQEHQQELAKANSTLDQTQPLLKGAGDAYQSMATTGGYTPTQESNYINRATSAATAAGNAYADQAKLAVSRTGQGNPQAVISRISRQAGQNASEGAVNAEAGLNEQENANKLAGAGGLVSTGNANTNVGQVQANMVNQSAQQQLAAMGLQFNSEEEAQQALDSLSHNPGIFDNIMRVGQLATGAVSSYAGLKKAAGD